MSIVKFAVICDKCGARSGEWSGFPCCRECLDDTCPDCDMESERDDETSRTLCSDCCSPKAPRT